MLRELSIFNRFVCDLLHHQMYVNYNWRFAYLHRFYLNKMNAQTLWSKDNSDENGWSTMLVCLCSTNTIKIWGFARLYMNTVHPLPLLLQMVRIMMAFASAVLEDDWDIESAHHGAILRALRKRHACPRSPSRSIVWDGDECRLHRCALNCVECTCMPACSMQHGWFILCVRACVAPPLCLLGSIIEHSSTSLLHTRHAPAAS
jgi:hypothetical protein